MTEIGSNQCSLGYASNVTNVAVTPKKKTPRKNPWGNSSYADLITQAIEASPEKKLTLSQIYDWMIRNIPHFSNQGSSNSSAGWKNSIRHNLSLHERFLRIRNEESSGKSSWWTINKAAGIGRTTRRKNGGKKKLKGFSSPQKSLLKKITAHNLNNQCFSSSTFKDNLQKLSSFSNPEKRRWFSCSSISSEDTESLQSRSSTSPPSNESEILRENFYNTQSTFSPLGHYHPVHVNASKYISSANNTSSYLDPEFYGHNQVSLKGYEAYHSLDSKYPTHLNDQQNSQCVNTFTNVSVEEDSYSTVSAEYFKIPHHLSGSYMTSEISRIENTYNSNTSSEKQNSSSFVINSLDVNETQESLVQTETQEFNGNTVFVSSKSENLLRPSFISQHPREINNEVFIDDLNQNQIKIEYNIFNENETSGETKTNTDDIQTNLGYYVVPDEMKSMVLGDETVNVSNMEDMRLNQNHAYIDVKEENVYDIKTEIPTYMPCKYHLHEKFMYDTEKAKKCYRNIIDNQKEYIKTSQNVVKSNKQSSLQNEKNSIPSNPTFSYNSNDCLNISCASIKVEPSSDVECDKSFEDYPMDQSKKSPEMIATKNNQELKNSNESYIGKTLSKSDNDKSYLNVKGTHLPKNPNLSDGENNQECCSFITDVAFMYETDQEFDTTGNRKFNKLDVLIYKMVTLVLLKVENMELSKPIVNEAFVRLHSLSLGMSQKKFLVILTELLFALKASYKCRLLNGSIIYSNHNNYYAALLLSHFGYEADLNSAFCLYANVLDAFISEDFIEKVLGDSRIKYMDNPPNLILYLQLYLTDVLTVEHVAEGIKISNSKLENPEDDEKFIPASVTFGYDICDLCDEVNIMSNINYSYVHHIEYFIKRRFLDNDIKIHPSTLQPNLNVLQSFLSAIKLKPKNKLLGVNLISAPSEKKQSNVINMNIIHENELSDINIQVFDCEDSHNGNTDILPRDLVNVQVSSNFNLTLDYRNIDFEFSNYDLSYDAYL